MLNMAIITGFLSRTKDRFHEYNEPLALDQKFRLMTEIEGYDGVEIVYPYEVKDPAGTKQLLNKYGLNVAAVNVNVKAEPEFRHGGLTSHDKAIRDKAVRFIKESKDFAAALGADKVGLSSEALDRFVARLPRERGLMRQEIERLIQLLARLPGLGPRSARRAALHLIKKREALMAPLTSISPISPASGSSR